MNNAKLLTILLIFSGCSSRGYVLHRAGNPPEIYIAKFDAMSKPIYNLMNCKEFIKYIEASSPQTGPIICSPEK
jgi:hypothetical protein